MAKKKAMTSSVKTHAADTPKYLDVHKKDPSKAYRFVRKTAQDVGRRQMDGWVIVNNEGDNSPLGPNYDGSSQIATDDLVLMETSIENRDALRARPIARQKRRMEGTTDVEAHLDGRTKITEETLPSGGDASKIFE